MDTSQYQKIQNLVKSAGILSAAEKSDWLDLMDLMNGHQLLELEKILTGSRQPGAGSQSSFNQQISRPELPAAHLAELPAPAGAAKPPALAPPLPKKITIAEKPGPGPSFKHILNFPKAVGLEAGKELLAKTFPPKVESRQEAPQKKQSAFLTSLKAIFAEKELPPGREVLATPVKPAIPPAPVKKIESRPEPEPPARIKFPEKKSETENVTINLNFQSPADIAKLPGLENVGRELKEILDKAEGRENIPEAAPGVSAPAGLLQTSPAPQAKPEIVRPASLTIQADKVNIVSPVIAKAPEADSAFRIALSDDDIQELAKKQEQVSKKSSEDENVTPGLNFFEASLKQSPTGKPGDGETKARAAFVKRSAKIILLEKPGDDMRLETLEDTAELSVADLKEHAAGTFFRKLQKLAAQNGQHEVVFNLEKSPLYKAYVNTGVQLLKDQANFEKRSNQEDLAGSLERKDFEQFADLLIVMGSKA